MNPLTDALKRVDDARPVSEANGMDELPDLSVHGGWRLEPIRATRDDTDQNDGGSVTEGVDGPFGPDPSSGWRLESVRPTRDDTDQNDGGSVTEGVDGPFGPDPSSGWRLEPGRATRDDTDQDDGGSVTEGVDGPFGPDPSSGWRLEPGRAMRDDTNQDDGGSAGDGVDGPSGPPDTAGDSVGETRHEPLEAAGSPPLELRAFDPRCLPRRRSIVRLIGTTLAALAAIGAGTGGGYLVWQSEFVRPALVRRLSLMQVPVMDLAPVHAANAAMSIAEESGAGAVLRTDDGLAVSTPDSADTRQEPSSAEESTTGSRDPASRSSGPRSSRLQGSESPGSDARGSAPVVSAVEPMARLPAGAPPGTAHDPAPATARAEADSRPVPGAGIEIRKRIRPDYVTASLERAYDALLAGDGASAAEAYRVVLAHEPGNRDAYLGLAAVAARAGRWDEATGYYAQVLAFHPADTIARAALIANDDEDDPARDESRLKALLRNEPQAAHLHFSLGNVYAVQSRWSEARQSYSTAHHFDRGNPDYAYNLAVSLDHLSRHERALGLYREVLVLSRSRPASFEVAAVRQRIRDLDGRVASAGTGTTPADAGAASTRPDTQAPGTGPAVHPR